MSIPTRRTAPGTNPLLPATDVSERTPRQRLVGLLSGDRPYAVYAAFIILIVGFSFASPAFLSVANFANIGRQTALVTIVAVGMTFVIIGREIDLSVGSVIALSAVCSALAMRDLANEWYVGVLAACAVGATAGLVHSFLVVRVGLPAFLVTLASLGIARGLALMVTDTRPVLIDNPTYEIIFSDASLMGIPAAIVWTALIVAAGFTLLHMTTFGQRVYATGGNDIAARYAGIKTGRVKTVTFVLTGVLAGLAALILTARLGAARPDLAAGIELDIIAAVILGGTSLFGGKGAILGTVLGSLLIGVVNNGMVLLGAGISEQLVFKGLIVIAAVAFSRKNGA